MAGETPILEVKTVETTVVSATCCDLSNATYDRVIKRGGSSIDADKIAYAVYNACELEKQ